MRARPIKWRGDVRRFDKYELFEAYLWGAKMALQPGTVKPPMHPTLAAEFWNGWTIANQGYISLVANADPIAIVKDIKLQHELRRKYYADTYNQSQGGRAA